MLKNRQSVLLPPPPPLKNAEIMSQIQSKNSSESKKAVVSIPIKTQLFHM